MPAAQFNRDYNLDFDARMAQDESGYNDALQQLRDERVFRYSELYTITLSSVGTNDSPPVTSLPKRDNNRENEQKNNILSPNVRSTSMSHNRYTLKTRSDIHSFLYRPHITPKTPLKSRKSVPNGHFVRLPLQPSLRTVSF
jgi:hypothetical protein